MHSQSVGTWQDELLIPPQSPVLLKLLSINAQGLGSWAPGLHRGSGFGSGSGSVV